MLVCTNLSYDQWKSRTEDWWRSRLVLGIRYPSARTLGLFVYGKERHQIWAEPEGMLVTFHVFSEFTVALIKCGCVQNYAVVSALGPTFVPPPKRDPGLGYVWLKRLHRLI